MFHGNVSVQIAKGLRELQKRIQAARIPPSKLDETLNLATWNIRDFGKKKRSEAAVHYIAEIIGQFDVVSIVEVRDDLTDLARVLAILGPTWRAVYSDMIPDAGGNRERIAFVYDRRAATFTGFAANALPPRKKDGTEYKPVYNWWRSPYIASFSAGNLDFVVITTHIQWGTKQGRMKELNSFATWVDLKRKQHTIVDKDIFVTGDFNVEDPKMYAMLTSKGLKLPTALKKGDFGSNLSRSKRYDQILHMQNYPESFINKGGVLDFFTGGTAVMFPGLSKDKYTYQMSDHLPLWVQINTDNDAYQLDQLIRAKSKA